MVAKNNNSGDKLGMTYARSFNGLAIVRYNGMMARARSRFSKVKLLITKEEFLDLILRSKTYQAIYKDWVESGFQKKLAPSIDRIDNNGHYSRDNIQVVTSYENTLKNDGEYQPNIIHLREKRDELIWALRCQGYNFSQIGEIFNVGRPTIFRIVRRKPKNWKPKWAKVHE